MGEICLGSKELQVNLSPKSESLPTFLVNLMQQAEKYLKSCNIPETLKVLYHVFNLVPIFSTEYKSIRHIILTLHSYFQRRQISLSLIPRLKIRHFTYQKYKQNYLFELANSLLPYAEQRRQALLSALQVAGSVSEERLAVIRDFDLETYYRSRFGVHGSLPRALGAFCGKDDKFESLEKSIEKFSSHFSRS